MNSSCKYEMVFSSFNFVVFLTTMPTGTSPEVLTFNMAETALNLSTMPSGYSVKVLGFKLVVES